MDCLGFCPSLVGSRQVRQLGLSRVGARRGRILRRTVGEVIPVGSSRCVLSMSQTEQTEEISGRKTFTVSKPLGVVLEELESGTVFVASVAGDGNAGEAGIQKGDLVIGVDSKLFAGKGLETVMSAITDGSSESVQLLVERTVSVPTANKLDDRVREKLRSEISAPYRQNWLGIMVVAVLTLIVLARFSGIR